MTTLRGEGIAGPAIPLGAPGPVQWWEEPDVEDGGPALFNGKTIGEIVADFTVKNPDVDPFWTRWMRVQMDRAALYREHIRALVKAGKLVMRPIRDSASKSQRVIGVALREAAAPRPVAVPWPSKGEREFFELHPGDRLAPGWLLPSTVEIANIAMKSASRDLGMLAHPTIRWYAEVENTPDWLLNSQPVERVWDGETLSGFVLPQRPDDIWLHAGLQRDPGALQGIAAHETFHVRAGKEHGFPTDPAAKEAEETAARAYATRALARLGYR